MFKKFVFAAVAALVVGVASTANAATIFTASTLPGCENCYGLTYTLTVGDAGDAVATTYDATMNVTGTLSAAGTAAGVSRISAIEFKPAGNVADIPAPALTLAPNGAINWDTVEAASNNNGCGNGGGGFVCSEADGPAFFADITGSPVNLTWAWTFSLAAGVTPQPLHIGVKLNNAAGDLNGQVISQSTFTSVPDGGMTLSLLGLALAGMGLVRRRLS